MCISTFVFQFCVIVLLIIMIVAFMTGIVHLSCWISEMIFGETDYFILFLVEALFILSIIVGVPLTLVLYLTGYIYFCS